MFVTKYKNFNFYFLLVVLAYFLSINFLPSYEKVTKPLIMASLLGFYISGNTRQNSAFLLGMIFALLGDVFLLFEGGLFFTIGLFSFLLMQVSYASVFLSYKGSVSKNFWLLLALLVVFSSFLLFLLWPGLGDDKVAVCVYILAILIMVTSGLSMNIPSPVYNIVNFGTLSFLISDAVLALNKFYQPVIASDYIIMIPYIAAQYCIVTGMKELHSQTRHR
jgi:uncharacterized membrane protein YhhN